MDRMIPWMWKTQCIHRCSMIHDPMTLYFAFFREQFFEGVTSLPSEEIAEEKMANSSEGTYKEDLGIS